MTDLDVAHAIDPDVHLLVPADDEPEPELSIVIPALNESLTITDFVEWCHQGLKAADIRGEILIVDSSDDDTAELALAGGARVLKTPRRGLGRAYIDALPYIRGRYVLMGDADCTYDFRELGEFVGPFRAGYEFVMGSRWKGSIEKGAMPGLHQYFGTPFTTWILNRVYGSKFSDIHCGMRGISRDALERMDISSQSWEYASEMVLKSVHMDLRTIEAPVTFLKDREGRLSHHKRSGWFSPFSAAWINLRAMFVYGADFFLLKPGIVLALLGLMLTVPVSFGAIDLGVFTLSLYWQFLGVTVLAVGTQALLLGCIAQVLFDYTGRNTVRWTRLFPYTRTVVIAMVLVAAGIGLSLPLTLEYVSNDLVLDPEITTQNNLAVTGLAAAITGAQLFVSTLVLHGTIIATSASRLRHSTQEYEADAIALTRTDDSPVSGASR
jgi:glycosyltransferase involved in cell wall biosynthesis